MIAANGDIEVPKEYSYQKPEQALTVPHEYVKQVLMRGGVFSGSKKRIYAMFQDISDPGERVKAVRKEYGQGGAGWPLEGDGLHGYDTFHAKGLRFQWREGGTEIEGYMNWKAVERELGALIMTGNIIRLRKHLIPTKYRRQYGRSLWMSFSRKVSGVRSQTCCYMKYLQKNCP